MGWVVWLGDQEQERKIGNEEMCERKAVAGPVTRGAEREDICVLCGYPRWKYLPERRLSASGWT